MKLTLETEHPNEIKALLLSLLATDLLTAVRNAPAQEPPAQEPPAQEPPAQEPKRRGRPSKAQEPAATEPPAPAAEELDEATAMKRAVEAATAFVKSRKAAGANGMAEYTALMQDRFGANTVADACKKHSAALVAEVIKSAMTETANG